MEPRRKPGRPRSAYTHEAILVATGALLAEVGYDLLSIEGVAARAGVGKPTIYRRWPSKRELVAAALAEGVLVSFNLRPPHTDDLEADLRAWLNQLVAGSSTPQGEAVMRAATSIAADDPKAAALLAERFVRPTVDALERRLKLAIDEGQVRKDANLGAVSASLVGSVLFQLLTGRAMTPVLADGLMDLLLQGLRR